VKKGEIDMSEHIALTAIRGIQDAQSARPWAPVVDDGFSPRPARRTVRRSVAATLRLAAVVERRWADRLDPAAARPLVARG
jgi:hypothetical protein